MDGQPTGRYTPSQLELPPGRHQVEVRKDGFEMEGRAQTLTLESDRTGAPLHFQLRRR